MKKQLLFLLLSFTMLVSVSAQRYLTPQFNEVTVTTTAYGANYTVLLVPSKGKTVKQPLAVDIYQPKGDTETARPVAIFLHSGNFLPNPQNGATNGLRIDSTAIEVCTRLAKMGYVTASIDYRLGWNPLASTQEGRINGLINAAYRGVQDAKTAVRFFKEKATDFKVDTNKIMLIGQGTGGYISLGAASLDNYLKVVTTTAPQGKFIGANGLPFVIQQLPAAQGGSVINGDPEGKLLGRVPFGPGGVVNPGPPPSGDTLCLPNWTKHTSKFQFQVNLGGALGDISWMDKNTPPMISFQTPTDIYAPYKSAILYVPVPPNPLPVVEVQGAFEVQKKAAELGTNKSFDCNYKAQYDPYGPTVAARNSGYHGLVPVFVKNVKDTGPWDFWDIKKFDSIPHPNAPQLSIHKVALSNTPDASPKKARIYLDSVIGYFLPRAYNSMKLGTTQVCQPALSKVTFSVDMKNETVDAAKGVCVAGDFQKDAGFPADWTPGTTKLVNKAGTSIWEYTADLPAGKAYNFKFINDNGWNGKEEKMSGKGCYADDNRSFTVGAAATTVGTFCYNKCFACDEFAVKLSVDMSKETAVDAAGVYVAGAFQGWDPAKTKMNQVGTTKVYTLTVGMKTGAQEYKFINGNAWGKDESVSGVCGSGNRKVTLNNGGYNTGEVCFKLCTKCDGTPSGAVGTIDANLDSAVSVFPNPTAGDLTVAYNFTEEVSNISVRVINTLGQVVAERAIKNAFSGNTSFNLSNMPAGFYTVVISNGSAFSSKRVVVQK